MDVWKYWIYFEYYWIKFLFYESFPPHGTSVILDFYVFVYSVKRVNMFLKKR